ncbi:MAG: zinc ribbon domain-containing protein [Eubacteriales bacterium]
MSQNNNQDTALKTVGTVVFAVIAFALLYNILGSRTGFGFYGQGLDFNGLIVSILALAVKLLWFVLVISLGAGVVILIKKHVVDEKKIDLSFIEKFCETGYTCPCCGSKLTAEFKFCPNCKASLKDTCAKCGKDLQVGWKCCPSCGTEKGTANE